MDRPRKTVDRLLTIAMVGGLVVIVGLFGLISLYLGMVNKAVSQVHRTSVLPNYEGRPAPAEAPSSPAINYLVLATDDDGGLSSAIVMHLSAGRDSLHLIGIPSNLLLEIPGMPTQTLAQAYATHADVSLMAIEEILQARMDHRLELKLTQFVALSEVVGGVQVINRRETAAEGHHWPEGEVRIAGDAAVAYVESPPDAVDRLERSQAVLRELLRMLTDGRLLTTPATLATVTRVLNECLVVDAALTPSTMRTTAMELRLTKEHIDTVVLPLQGRGEWRGRAVTLLDQVAVEELSMALMDDLMSSYVATHAPRWADLITLPPR
ncbi:MAG: LCP family protein [Micropruina sp.]